MDRIYKNRTKLRVQLLTECDLSGYQSVSIMARKPDNSVVVFPAVVKDIESGLVFYDVQSEDDFDQSGWWWFWAEVVFDDDRTACSEAVEKFVYEPGR